MVLERREPATFAALYAPTATSSATRCPPASRRGRQLDEQWMGWLRQQAGLDRDWVPPDEARGKSSADDA